jgi:TPR repeat protein
VFLLIILGAAGYLAWQWRQGGFPFNRQTSSSSGGAQQSASPSEVAPAMNQNQQTHIDKPMTGVGDVLPTAPEQKTQPDSTGKATEFPAPGGQNPATPQKAGAAPSANESAEDSSTEKAASKTTEKAEATPPPSAAKSRGTKETSMRTRVPNREPQTAAPATSPDADLELAGERYLYGTGLPQNCPRAESSLRTAATHGNTKAQTVLGTMYATGHCVGRDLPTAYRWFARALHQDPQNSRISADLQVLWRQMTPQEKQLATASGQ